jgi:hypothetical protein
MNVLSKIDSSIEAWLLKKVTQNQKKKTRNGYNCKLGKLTSEVIRKEKQYTKLSIPLILDEEVLSNIKTIEKR